MLKSDPRSSRGLRELEELEDRIEKLKHSYDLFFSGVDNIDPSQKKVPIRRLITRLNEMHIKNPRIRFRFQSLVGRFVSLNQYWERTMRAIEDGKLERSYFRRPVQRGDKAQAYFGKEAPDLPEREISGAEMLGMGTPQEKDKVKRKDIRVQTIDENDVDKMRHKRPLEGPDEGAKRQKREAATPGGAKSADRFDPQKAERVYNDLVAARGDGQDSRINKDTMSKQLEKQYQSLRSKYKDADIDFKVVKKDGRVVVKPVVKKG